MRYPDTMVFIHRKQVVWILISNQRCPNGKFHRMKGHWLLHLDARDV